MNKKGMKEKNTRKDIKTKSVSPTKDLPKTFKPKRIILTVLLILLGLSWLLNRVRINEHSGVQVTSNNEAEVEINGMSVGKTPYYADNMEVGTADIKMTDTKSGQVWKEKITLDKGSLTSVHRDFGDVEYKSHGYVLNMEKQNKSSASVSITSTPANATVSIDSKPQGFTPFTMEAEPGSRVFTFTYQGYEDKTIYASPMSGYRLKMNFTMASLEIPPTLAPKTSTNNLPLLTSCDHVQILYHPAGLIRVNTPWEDSYNSFVIDSKKSPKLFDINYTDTDSGIRVTCHVFDKTPLIVATRLHPDHGSNAPGYIEVYDFNGNTVYANEDYLTKTRLSWVDINGGEIRFSGIYSTNYGLIDPSGEVIGCTSCGIDMVDYFTYDAKKNKFVSSNIKHLEEIKKIVIDQRYLTPEAYSSLSQAIKNLESGKDVSLFSSVIDLK